MTMTDLTMGCCEIEETPHEEPETIANVNELAWSTGHSRPEMIVLDSKFMTTFQAMMENIH